MHQHFGLALDKRSEWSKTGYSFQLLFNEKDFNPSVCIGSSKRLQSCLLALNYLNNQLPTRLQIDLPLDIETDINLTEVSFKDLENYFEQLSKLAQNIKVDSSYIAGETYNTYLKEAYDQFTRITPYSLVFSKDRKGMEPNSLANNSYYINFSHQDNNQALYVPIHLFPTSAFNPGMPALPICTQFRMLIRKDMKKPESVGLIIDLRGNPGGSIDQVLCMLDAVISSEQMMFGTVPIVDGQLLNDNTEYIYFGSYFSPHKKRYDKPIVVLINKDSASASEIFAGAIKDMQRGLVIGEKSFGKGTQQILNAHLKSEDTIHYDQSDLVMIKTTGVYLLPSGRSPNKEGIKPDVPLNITNSPSSTDNNADWIEVYNHLRNQL